MVVDDNVHDHADTATMRLGDKRAKELVGAKPRVDDGWIDGAVIVIAPRALPGSVSKSISNQARFHDPRINSYPLFISVDDNT
jgi:hypothetical protein